MRKLLFITSLVFFLGVISTVYSQAGMVEKYGGGQYFNAEQYKIDRMKAKTNEIPSASTKYEIPTDYSKPKKGMNSSGQIWIDGYCRFRPASSSAKRFCSDMSEIKHHTPEYPVEMQRYSDNFSGKGNIAWDQMNGKIYNEKTGYIHVADSLNDGISLTFFQKLLKESEFFSCTEPGGKYEFSRAWKFWVKRVSGPKNMPLEFSSQYSFPNGEDYSVLKIEDNGSFEIGGSCYNCEKSQFYSKKGTAKLWIEGGWNEITISKDELNTIKILVNDELLSQYQIPNMPITTRYRRCRISLPYEWQKKKLMYNVGEVIVESYSISK